MIGENKFQNKFENKFVLDENKFENKFVPEKNKFEPGREPTQAPAQNESREEGTDDLKPVGEEGGRTEEQPELKTELNKDSFVGQHDLRAENVEPKREPTFEGQNRINNPKTDLGFKSFGEGMREEYLGPNQEGLGMIKHKNEQGIKPIGDQVVVRETNIEPNQEGTYEGLGMIKPKADQDLKPFDLEPVQERTYEGLGMIKHKNDQGLKQFGDLELMREDYLEPNQERSQEGLGMIKHKNDQGFKQFGGQHEMRVENVVPKEERTFESYNGKIEPRIGKGYKSVDDVEEEQVEPEGEQVFEVEPRHDRMDDFKPEGGLVAVNETMLRAVGLVEEKVFN